jgi:hypothetical protein
MQGRHIDAGVAFEQAPLAALTGRAGAATSCR